ncbi:MAG: Hsp70 family protein [Clostridiales bacterium]|jgi:molecular chaperone DnaK|nr:Hsp70 family protein [Clostridiales bacterium]
MGIDFGTCFSFPAVFINNEPRSLLPTRINGGNRGIPSVFYRDSKVGELAGIKAEQYGERNPDCSVTQVKREISSGRYILDSKAYTASEVCSRILKEVVSLANEQLEVEYRQSAIYEAVLAVPVSYGDKERTLLRQAAQLPKKSGGPGLSIKCFIQEPVAAAIDYSEMISSADHVLVYDLGGGTFDVALIVPTPREFHPYKVVDFDGANIGGKDFDQAFCDFLEKKFRSHEHIEPCSTKRGRAALLKAARTAKEELSGSLSAPVEIQQDGLYYEVEATREEFSAVINPLLQKTLDKTKALVERNHLMGAKYLQVVLVGGSSYMPQVRAGLEKALGSSVRIHLHRPDKAIAFGASRFADNDNIVMQLAPYSYGIGAYLNNIDGITNLIFAKTPLPTKTGVKEFITRADNLSSQEIVVYQNVSPNTRVDFTEAEKTMDATLRFSKAVPRGTSIHVEMLLEKDGTLAIKVIDPATGKYGENSVNIIRT